MALPVTRVDCTRVTVLIAGPKTNSSPFVKVNPTGDPRSEIWAVGEAPGRNEHLDQVRCNDGRYCRGKCQGHVFVGDAGATLDVWLEKVGLDCSEIYVRNVVSVWPGAEDPYAPKSGSKKPSDEMVESESEGLKRALRTYKPKFVLALGAVAIYELLGGSEAGSKKMEAINGRPCPAPWDEDCIIIPITHPAAGLHDPHQAVQTWLGLKSASQVIRRGVKFVPIKKDYKVLRTAAEVKAALRGCKAPIGVDTEGYAGDPWSLQFATAPGKAYLIYAYDREAIAAFAKYAPRPWTFHNVIHDLGILAELGIILGPNDYRCTLVMTYITAREMAKGKADSDEASIMGQGLKSLSYKYLNERMSDFSKMVAPHVDKITEDYLYDVWSEMLGPSEPEVVNKYTSKPQSNDVNVMRGGPWGNPFPIVKTVRENKKKGIEGVKGRTRAQVIKAYREWIATQPKLLARLPELIGKRLVCCCRPSKCHGDVLAKLVKELPGPFHIPREGKGQLPSNRILAAILRPKISDSLTKLYKSKPEWQQQIESRFGPRPRLKLADIPKAKFEAYAIADPDMTLRLDQHQSKILTKYNLWQPYNIDMGIIPMLSAMTSKGLKVDLDRLDALRIDLEKAREAEEVKLLTLAVKYDFAEFEPNSNDNVATLLFDCMEVDPPYRKTQKGRPSVDEKTLAGMALVGDAKKFRVALLKYKEYQVLLDRYVYLLPGFSRRFGDGRIHPQWRHTVTVSGRLACGGKDSPNLLAFPSRVTKGERPWAKELRACFIPDEGNVYLSVDLSQIELRVLASESGDEAMMYAFNNGIDLHKQTVRNALGLDPESEEGQVRRVQAKTVNFGVAYGLSGPGLRARLAMMGVDSTDEECQDLIDRKKLEWPQAFAYLEAAGEELYNSKDAIARDMWDRIRFLPMIWSPVQRAQAEARRQAGNMKIQGGAQGVEKLGMKAWWNQRHTMRNWHPLLQIHDDVVFEGPEREVKKISVRIREIFEQAAQHRFKIPIKADAKWGSSWGVMENKAA